MIHEDSTRRGLSQIYLAACCRKAGYDPLSKESSLSARSSIPSSEPRSHDDFVPHQWNASSPPSQSCHHSSSPIRHVENTSLPVHTSSQRSTPIGPLTSRVRQLQGNRSSFPDSDALSLPHNSTRSQQIAYCSDSACFEVPVQKSLESATHATSNVPLSPHSFRPLCAARDHEEICFKNTFIAFALTDSATVENSCRCCERLGNELQVFQAAQKETKGNRSIAAPVWKFTRRLVLSKAVSSTALNCQSLWLPLTDVQFSLRESTVTLQWSDCNQPQQTIAPNQHEYWSLVYNPVRPNHELTVEFCDAEAAKGFVNTVRFPLEDGSAFNMSESQEIRIWDVSRPGTKEVVVNLTNHEESGSDSTLFIVGRYIDPRIDISSQDRHMTVRINNIQKPTYLSDITSRPTLRKTKAARFLNAQLVSASLAISASLLCDRQSPVPPLCMTEPILMNYSC
jgi:hypothetical protein